MIMKHKTLPYKLLGLEAMARRLPESHIFYNELEKELRVVRAGENGEKLLTGVFQKYQLQKDSYVFHDLHLQSTALFQMDTLLLNRHGAFIFEMKNIAGRIRFPDEQNQLIRTLDNGQVDAFECPSVQLERNRILLQDWFHAHQFCVPIHGAVVFPRPQQIFENKRSHLKILFPLEVPVYIRQIERLPAVLDASQLLQIARKLADSHQDYNPYPLCTKYSVDPAQLATGVRCNKCGTFGMQSVFKGWGCTQCKNVSRNAHLQAFLDYYMLISNTMTNRECREFLQLPNTNKTTRLLKQINAISSGEKKGRNYRMNLPQIEQLYLQSIDREKSPV